VKVVKNKMAPPFKQAEFDILFGAGISREGSLIDFGVEHEIVRKSGAWYTYDGDQLGQGKENSRNFLLENPKIAAEIEQKIMLKLGIGAEAKAAQTKAAADAIVAEAEQVKAAGAKASGPVLAVAAADEPGLPSAVGE
ncbi:MAG TPA: DNA recombination/repair protein RecA, partial [Rhodoglobus sp.]|nr:DNA recombination/repair protein RecA [Rhodoglobus sp.]